MRNERPRQATAGAVPLQDEGAERAIIGICLSDPSAFWDCSGKLQPTAFTVPRLARIWAAMCRLAELGKPVAREMLSQAIIGEERGDLPLPAYVAALLADSPRASFAGEFCDTLVHLAGRRALLDKLDMLRDQMLSLGADVSIEEAAESAIGQISAAAGASFDRHMKSYGEFAEVVRDRVAKSFEGGAEQLGFSSGLRAVDEVWGRTIGGRLYSLAGISGAGKSALARQITESMAQQAAKAGSGWGYVGSLEMSGEESLTRAIAADIGLPASRIDESSLGMADVEKIYQSAARMKSLPIMLDTRPRLRMSDIRSRMIRLKNQRGLAFAVFDHLLLIKPEGRSDSLMDRVADATIECKLLARELDIPIILLVQVNEKTASERPGGKPIINDLFGGQTIKQNSDAVCFIHRPEIHLRQNEPSEKAVEKHAEWSLAVDKARGKAEFYDGKRRSGASFNRRFLEFIGDTMTFKDV